MTTCAQDPSTNNTLERTQNTPMSTDPDSQTILDDLAHAEETQHMRRTWQHGHRAATTAAARLRQTAHTLAELSDLPLPATPYADPAEWFEPARTPELPVTTDTMTQMFATLIGNLHLIGHRYEQEAHNFTQALAELDTPRPFTAPPELRRSMHDGYDSDTVNSVLGRISALSGLRIVCIWDYVDAFGYAGHSEFYLEHANGEALHYLSGDLYRWLNAPTDDIDAPETPGEPATWIGAKVTEFSTTDLIGDDQHNYAFRNRR